MLRVWAKDEMGAEVHWGRSWSSHKLRGTASALDFSQSPRFPYLLFSCQEKYSYFFLPGEMSQFFLLRRILLKYCSSGECERWAASEHIQPFLGARRQNQPTKCIQQVQTSLPVCGTNKWNNVTQPTDQVHTSLVHLRISPLFSSCRIFRSGRVHSSYCGRFGGRPRWVHLSLKTPSPHTFGILQNNSLDIY